MEAPRTVVLYTYAPKTKQYERYDALVLSSRQLDGDEKLSLALAYFDHLDTASLHALNGIDWRDTIKLMRDVPHQSDVENQSFYWVEADAEHVKAIADMNAGIKILQKQLTETTEGRDAALQELADKGKRPSVEDLDTVSAEEAVREATEGRPKLVKGTAKKE